MSAKPASSAEQLSEKSHVDYYSRVNTGIRVHNCAEKLRLATMRLIDTSDEDVEQLKSHKKALKVIVSLGMDDSALKAKIAELEAKIETDKTAALAVWDKAYAEFIKGVNEEKNTFADLASVLAKIHETLAHKEHCSCGTVNPIHKGDEKAWLGLFENAHSRAIVVIGTHGDTRCIVPHCGHKSCEHSKICPCKSGCMPLKKGATDSDGKTVYELEDKAKLVFDKNDDFVHGTIRFSEGVTLSTNTARLTTWHIPESALD